MFILNKYHFVFQKKYGQNFLIDNNVVSNIVRTVLESGSYALEIGPGLGTLTSSLLRRFKKVIAVEYDKDLAKKLPGSFPGKKQKPANRF